MSKVIGIEMDEYNICKAKDDSLAPLNIKVPGIFITGACTVLTDVTVAVPQGGGTAGRTAQAIG